MFQCTTVSAGHIKGLDEIMETARMFEKPRVNALLHRHLCLIQMDFLRNRTTRFLNDSNSVYCPIVRTLESSIWYSMRSVAETVLKISDSMPVHMLI